MYSVSQRSQSVFQSRSVFQSNVKWDGGVLISQKSLIVDYANTTNVEFIVDLKVLFYGWLIYSYCTKVDQVTVRGVCRLVLWQHYTGLLIFRGKKSKISRDFQGQIRGKIGPFRGKKVKICGKIGRFRGIFAGKKSKFAEKSAHFAGV